MSKASPIRIRAGTAGDMETVHGAILALADHVGADGYVTSTPDDLRRFGFSENPAFSVEIAEIDGVFAGMCLHFPSFSTWMGMPGVYIQDLYIEKAFRGRGVGEALLRHVARLTREAGGGYLRLSVDTDNDGAKAFYERLGIRRSEYEQVNKLTGESFVAFCEGGQTT